MRSSCTFQMAGCGCSGGRVRARTPEAEPDLGRDTGEWQAPQYLEDLLAPLRARMEAIEQLMSIRDFVPPPEVPAVPIAPDVVPATEQELWMRTIGIYIRCRAPEFQGGCDPLVAYNWKEDVGHILDLLGVDPVQRQRLAAFSLRGDADKWYRLQFSEEERLTVL